MRMEFARARRRSARNDVSNIERIILLACNVALGASTYGSAVRYARLPSIIYRAFLYSHSTHSLAGSLPLSPRLRLGSAVRMFARVM